MRRLAVVVAAPVALATVAGTPPSSSAPLTLRPSDAPARLAVTVYALGSLLSWVIHREAHALTAVGVASVLIRRDGSQVRGPTTDPSRPLRLARFDRAWASP
jgi:hypothetical protein